MVNYYFERIRESKEFLGVIKFDRVFYVKAINTDIIHGQCNSNRNLLDPNLKCKNIIQW